MKFKTSNKRSAGFTLVEILAATAILVILLAVGMVSVARYAKLLRLTELDNAAREIYMAAENRAVLLLNSGKLETMYEQDKTGGGGVFSTLNAGGGADDDDDVGELGNYYIYHTTGGEDVLADLLPEGTVDPALRKGCFYVVYNIAENNADGEEKLDAASVTDVFYAEDTGALDNGNLDTDFYISWRGSSRSERLEENRMLGYFGSGSVDSGSSTPLYEPIVEIINGEELMVRVSYTVRSTSTRSAKLHASLSYQDRTIGLQTDAGATGGRGLPWPEVGTEHPEFGMTTYTYTWVLDTLKAGGPQSKNTDIFGGPGMTLGGDFTVSAYVQRGSVKSKTKSDTGNTLFADGSGGDTAYIANLRHLQNLDHDFSGVTGKAAAVQTADIDCGASMFTDYKFKPIKNDRLKSYDGDSKFIKGLKVTDTSAAEKPGAGLFATVVEESESKHWEFKNIRLINTSVKAGAKPAGALVGSATNASFDGCWVYWESDGGESPKELLKENDKLKYQIAGTDAGGLVGTLSGGTINSCLAATLVQGTTAGGLVGSVQDNKVEVTNSYADCYLLAPTAGGLIGSASSNVTLNTVYTAGFIDNPAGNAKAAGFCNTTVGGTVSAQNAYSAMYYEKTGDGVQIQPLAPGVTSSETNKCHYLTISAGYQDKSYEQMASSGFFDEMGVGFERKGSAQSNPYHLRKDLETYPLPGVKDLPQYGDWNAEFLKTSLVYYEKYSDDTYGVSGGNLGTLRDDLTVVEDGYAVVFNQMQTGIGLDFELTGSNGDLLWSKENYSVEKFGTTTETKNGVATTYYLAPLPGELITIKVGDKEYADKDFFLFLNITPTDGGERVFAAYNPHFAKTASTMLEGIEETEFKADVLDSTRKRMEISVRTARHLNELSKHAEYYHYTVSGSRLFEFRQELDLDYRTYEGYGWNKTAKEQDPIGQRDGTFNGRYYGGCHKISGVSFHIQQESNRSSAGLFGVSTGLLQDIVYEMDPDPEKQASVSIGDKTEIFIGALVGSVESGEVVNCAVYNVNLRGASSDAKIYMGGLAGHNKGIIRNCAAESIQLKTVGSSFSEAFIGGLVGYNDQTGSVSKSYAVGYVTADADDRSEARVCGFVGFNRGNIRQSYAATSLKSNGKKVVTYGFCGQTDGSQTDTYYLNRGNFTYDSKDYSANYMAAKAKGTLYKDLTSQEQDSVLAKLGMDRVAGADSVFPYPTGVKKNGVAVHYGKWPEPVELGMMGVYYWEKQVQKAIDETTGKETEITAYNVSLLAADPVSGKVTKRYILSTERSNGSTVTDYGYGYYSAVNTELEVSAQNLWYTTDGGPGTTTMADWSDDKDVDKELEELMPEYQFCSYHSFVPNPAPDKSEIVQAGLYATGSPNGQLTLTQEVDEQSYTIVFQVNPHFADAMSAQLSEGWTTPSGTESAPTDAPGSAGNPYEVRAMGQLSAINWNSTNRNTKTVIQVGATDARNAWNFTYLSTSGTTGKYYWRQTHDLNGEGTTMTPIAGYYDNSGGDSGNLHGWFGGTYEGDDYVIEDINVQGQAQSSCTGLFGVVFQGKLSNVVMYSSDGKGIISTKANGGENGWGTKTESCWYAMGALVGLTGSSTIENCSAAGYTIEATVYTEAGWGGNNIGGLIGATDGGLSGCAAVTEIKVHHATENDNMRVGGLVGVSQGTISQCYAGGSIEFGEEVYIKRENRFIYVGGLVGGSYFKPLWSQTVREYVGVNPGDSDAKGKTSNRLEDCYSYVILPKQEAAGTKSNGRPNILALYALGGTGEINKNKTEDESLNYSNNNGTSDNHGTCEIKNCFYLKAVVAKNNRVDGEVGIPGDLLAAGPTKLKTDVREYSGDDGKYVKRSDPMDVTYNELSGKDSITKTDGTTKTIMGSEGWLTGFEAVTTREYDLNIRGKYSYSTKDNLAGLNYPFPTILTREGKTIHVHYGDWPLYGIVRPKGGESILLGTGAKTEPEYLGLSEGVKTGGEWNVESADPSIATAKITTDGVLTVTGVSEGEKPTTITVSYEVDGEKYELSIIVKVTTVLRLEQEQSPVYLFPNGRTKIPLALVDEAGNPVDLTKFKDYTLNLQESGVYYSEGLAESRLVQEDGKLYLEVRAGAAPMDETNVGILLRYSYKADDPTNRKDYYTVNPIRYRVVDLPGFGTPTLEEDGIGLKFTITPPKALKDYTIAAVEAGAVGAAEVNVTVLKPTSAESNWIKLTGNYAGKESVNLVLTLRLYDQKGNPVGEDQSGVQVTVAIPEEFRTPAVEEQETPPDEENTQAEEPEPVVEETQLEVEEPEPVVAEAQPEAEEPEPVVEETQPEAEEPEPAPVVEETQLGELQETA